MNAKNVVGVLVVRKRHGESGRDSGPRPIQLGLVIPPILRFFVSERRRRGTLCVTGGILAGESRSLALTVYALIAAISGPVPKMFMTRVRL
jgi:hypothetical protein